MALLTANIWQCALNTPLASSATSETITSAASSQAEADEWRSLLYRPTILFALGTMLLTGGLWWHTAVLSSVGKDTNRNFRVAERAHVSVLRPECKLIADPNGNLVGLKVWMVWRNSGRTPAAPMIAKTGATWTNALEGFDFDALDKDEANTEVRKQPLVLGPGADITSDAIFISPEHVVSAADGTGHQFFFGRAIYRDIFPQTPEHVIEFCFKVLIEGNFAAPITPHGRTPEIRFSIYGDRNRYYDKGE